MLRESRHRARARDRRGGADAPAGDRVGIFLASGTVVLLVRGFTAWSGGNLDPWPRGVQEEDRDRPWGSGLQPPTIPLPSPNLSRVRPAVHVR